MPARKRARSRSRSRRQKSNRMRKLAFALFLGAFSVAALYAQLAASAPARLLASNGIAEVQRGNVWVPIAPGALLSPGERVRTGRGSTAVVEAGAGRVITLNEGSQAQVRDSNGSSIVQLES